MSTSLDALLFFFFFMNNLTGKLSDNFSAILIFDAIELLIFFRISGSVMNLYLSDCLFDPVGIYFTTCISLSICSCLRTSFLKFLMLRLFLTRCENWSKLIPGSTISVYSFISVLVFIIAFTGQTAMHCPQSLHPASISLSGLPSSSTIIRFEPHTLLHNPHLVQTP